MSPTFVIVGAGMAGGKAVETLREEGFDGRVVLLGAEAERPYERPPLSKDYLRGEAERGTVYLQEDAGWYEENAVELRTSTAVESLDVAARAVVLAGGERIDYDALLLATGAEPKRPPIPGADLGGVHVLRTLEDSDGLRACSTPADGSSWSVGDGSAARWRPPRVSAGWTSRWWSRSRCPWRASSAPSSAPSTAMSTPTTASRCTSAAASRRSRATGAPSACARATGPSLDADAVVIGVGVAPAHRARRGVLDVENGILVDAALARAPTASSRRATSPTTTTRARAPARRALGQRPGAGSGGRAVDAGPGRRLRRGSPTSSPTSTTWGWSTRATPAGRRRRLPRRPGGARVHRLLAARRARHGGYERQRLGRQRAPPGARALGRDGRPGAATRPRCAPGRAGLVLATLGHMQRSARRLFASPRPSRRGDARVR